MIRKKIPVIKCISSLLWQIFTSYTFCPDRLISSPNASTFLIVHCYHSNVGHYCSSLELHQLSLNWSSSLYSLPPNWTKIWPYHFPTTNHSPWFKYYWINSLTSRAYFLFQAVFGLLSQWVGMSSNRCSPFYHRYTGWTNRKLCCYD